MQIILLEQAPNLGKLGDIVTVKDGYARNFLLPRKLARRATAAALKDFEARRADLEQLAAERRATADEAAARLGSLEVTLKQKAGVDGRLFGSVTNHDIALELNRLGVRVSKQQVRLPAGVLKMIGEHSAQVLLHPEVIVDVHVTVVGEPV